VVGAVLHRLASAASCAHRVAILRAGRVAADGPSGGVFAEWSHSGIHDQPGEVFPHPCTGAAAAIPRLLLDLSLTIP
jgi:iron complex transport system ATP-binding protein